jgi:hypothetical protein
MSSKILNVPYKRQWDPDAGQKKTDCGPCCVAMILAGMGKAVATNDVVNAAGGMSGDSGLLQWEVARKAGAFSLEMAVGSGFTLDQLKSFLDNGQPLIALIKYANLPDRVDKGSVNGHYVVVVGYDDARQVVFINDPDYFAGTTDGYQKAYPYTTWLAAWRGDNATDQTYNCSAIYPTKQGVIGGSGISTPPPTDQQTGDVYVVAPRGVQLRAQPSVSVGAPSGAIFGQHLTAIGAETAVDAAGYTWQKVRTDAGATAFVVASFGSERYLATTRPADPYLVTVLDVPAVRGANGLAIRDQPNPGLNALSRVQPGEQMKVFVRTTSGGLTWLWAQGPDGSIGWARESDAGQMFVSTTTPTPADTSNTGATSGEMWVTAASGIFVRQQPDQTAPFVDPNNPGVTLGAHLSVVGPTKDAGAIVWQQVKTDDGRQGWVAIRSDGESNVTSTQFSGEAWISAAGGLFLRPQADKNSGTVVKDPLPTGTHLTALGPTKGPDALNLIWQQVKTDDGRQGWVAVMGDGTPNVTTTKPTPPVFASVVPWGKCYAGLGAAESRLINAQELGVIRKSRVEAFKLLTTGDAGENKQNITELQKINSNMFIVARLFFSANRPNKFTPEDFVAFCNNGITACYEKNIRYFEVHNEPNHPNEGMDWNWSDGAGFGAWLSKVLAILRPRFPDAKFGYPGLQPQPNVPAFLQGSAAAIAQCDWIGVHNYWYSADQPPYPMNGNNAGMGWRDYRNRFPNKLLMITEFSNNSKDVSDTDKGHQYATYYSLLRNEPNLGAAFAFALNWPSQDDNKEGWIHKNGETQIANLVGAKLAVI